MIDFHLSSYSEMKDSGLPWVEQVPAHWELLPNRALVRQRKHIVGDRHPNFQLLSLTKQGVIVRDLTTLKGKFSEDIGTSQEVRAGDLIFCMFDVPETPRTVGLSRHYGMITGAYTVLETIGRSSKEFFEAFYLAMDNQKLLSPLYSGLRNTIPLQTFLQTKTPVPPESEQAAIVRFLDHMDRRIRRYIRAKQKMIKLLEQQKQTIVNRAVTRGLNANVRLKPSGTGWLGDVPEHWSIRPAKWLFHEVDERSLSGDEELLSVSHLTGVTSRSEKNITMFMAESYVGHKLCRPGDLVINTMWAWMAALGVSRQHGIVSPSYAVYRPYADSPLLGEFADLLLRTKPYISEFVCRSTGIRSSRLRLYPEQFLRIPILYPPAQEQEAILKYVMGETAETERAIGVALSQISLLREYRTRLIADVVTGKLDVQAVATRLPDEPEEPELLDDIGGDFSPDGESTEAIDETVETIDA